MRDKLKKIIIYMLIIALVGTVVFTGYSNGRYNLVQAAETTEAYVKAGTSKLRVRVTAGGDIMTDKDGNTIYLNGGHKLTVIDKTNASWYKVDFTYNGEAYTAYISSAYVVYETVEVPTEEEEITTPSNDTDFEAKLTAQKFPESYKTYLRKIHAEHPDWEFLAVHTGISWDKVIANEKNKTGQVKNLVYCTTSVPHYGWRSTEVGYSWSTDTWSSFDGSTWFAASEALVKYYIDPRVYLNSKNIFAFETLSYQEGLQNKQGVEAILKGTFMYDTVPKGETKKYSDLIMEAGKKYGVSPYHLAARMRLEMGTKGNVQAFGTHATYPGIYNYFNIGATDSAAGNAVTNGVKWAATSGSYGRPWNTVNKAIMGGAEYLSAAYISKKQDTLYTQKFNVTNTASLFLHQYMSNVQAPATESVTNYNAYNSNGILNSAMIFSIPVYTGMPAATCVKPNDTGSPNNFLKTLTVSGYSLTPTFAVGTTTDYSLIVDEKVTSVKVTATAVNSGSKISGTGTLSLAKGKNVYTIPVKAPNGDVRNYTLTIVRGSESQTTINPVETVTFTFGDVNSDGVISTLDIVKLQRVIVGLDNSTEELLKVGDINKDGKISTLDIVAIQRHIVGIELIK